MSTPRSASAGSSRQKSMAAQMLARSARTRWNSSTWRPSSAPTAEARSATQSACRERTVVSTPASRSRSRPNWRSGSRSRNRSPLSPLPSLDHGLLDQGPDELRDLLAVQPVPGTDRLRRVELEPAGEHRQACPQQSLGLAQELVAPVDRAFERLLPGRHAAVAGAERPEPGGEARDRAPSRPRALRRTAASSSASGMPSTWRADAQDRGGVRGVHGEARAARRSRAPRTAPRHPIGGEPPATHLHPRAATASARRPRPRR